MFYEKLEKNAVKCHLCPHQCKINESKSGICGVRENKEGILYSMVYGTVAARSINPIEKKPLFHFYPGSTAYSIATVGCNFRCRNCQNFDISQMPKYKDKGKGKGKGKKKGLIVGEDMSPQEIVAAAKDYKCKSISYTYTEPTIFLEYAFDIAKLAYKEGICNTFVSNGYITEEAIRTFAPYLDAINIDLKSLSDQFYRKNCGGHLQPVLDAIKLYKRLGAWVEVTTLVIPTLNDSAEDFRALAEFIRGVGAEIPWHITQFHPAYELTHLPLTAVTKIHEAREIGLDAGLRYVYEGNIPEEGSEDTCCYNCGKLLIRRYGFKIIENNMKMSMSMNGSKCPDCGVTIDGVF